MAFGVTDEIFGLSISQKGRLDPWYTYGVMSVAVPGWSLGTLAGINTAAPAEIISVRTMIFMPGEIKSNSGII